jgi:hypothetical protein
MDFGFTFTGCEPKPVRFLCFPLKVATPEFDEINEQPLMVAAAPFPEPPLACFFTAPSANQNLSAFCVFR